MLEAAERGGDAPRFVLVSSMAAAGPTTRGRPLRGDEPPRPVTAYGRSKLAAEQVVTASRLAWTIVRPPMVYGPRDREVLKVFRLARLGIAPVFGDGTQELSAVHGADLAEALIAAGTQRGRRRRTYYACHPEVFTSAELARAVGRAMGRSAGRHPGAGRDRPRRAHASPRPPPGSRGQTTILTADKANEFFQPAWTGDPGAADAGTRAGAPLATSRPAWPTPTQWYRTAGWL